jgi:hypothetical protein
MVTKEIALKNYVSVLRFIMEEYNKILPEVFAMPCLKYKSNTFFDETDPFKLVLQWNYFFRKNMKFFYLRVVEDDLEYFEGLILNNSFDKSLFEDDLNYFKESCSKFKQFDSEIQFIKDVSLLSVNETVKNTLTIYNEFKLISLNKNWFMSDLDFKHPKKFYMPHTLYNLASSLVYNSPDLVFSQRVEAHIRDFLLQYEI